jgi:hypothetical protein
MDVEDQEQDERLHVKVEPKIEENNSDNFDELYSKLCAIRERYPPCINGACVYFITNATYTKIGKTSDIKSRQSTIQTDNPLPVVLYHKYECLAALECEQELHNLFAQLRQSGEWFSLSSAHLGLIKAVLKLKRCETPIEEQNKKDTSSYRKRKLLFDEFAREFNFSTMDLHHCLCENLRRNTRDSGDIEKIIQETITPLINCPKNKRLKFDKLEREHVKDEFEWTRALEKVKDLPPNQLIDLPYRKEASSCERTTARLFLQFAHRADLLTVEHAQWYSKHRATIFNEQLLRKSREELETINYSDSLVFFNKPSVATAKHVSEVVDGVITLLRCFGVSLEQFLNANGTMIFTREQLNAHYRQIMICWETIDGVLWHQRGGGDKAEVQPSAVLRRIFRFFSRLLQIHRRYKNRVIEWSLKVDPIFVLLTS